MKNMNYAEMKLRFLEDEYGKMYLSWKDNKYDDSRALYVSLYKEITDALKSLPDRTHPYVMVAMDKKIRSDYDKMDEILAQFKQAVTIMGRTEQGKLNAALSKAKYDKEYTTQQSFKLNRNTDADILKWLESIPNKQGYIKALIREDMKKRDTD